MSSINTKAPAYILFCLFALLQSTETIFTTGLPQISEQFKITPGLAQICSTVYFCGFALGILTLGRVSDHFGRKPVVIFGLSIFLFSCIFSFYASNIYQLICLRFIQAFGASIGSVIAHAMARDSYRGVTLSKLYSSLAVGIAIMPGVGSLIGGSIVQYLNWRYNFLYLFMMIFIVQILCIFRLPETNNHIGKSDSKKFWEILKYMMNDKEVLCYGGIIGCFNGIMYSFYIEAPFIFIKKLNIHPSKYGFLILLISISGIIGSGVGRFLQSREIDGKKIIKGGIIFSLFSCALFVILTFLWTYKHISDDLIKKILIIPILTQGISFSIVMPLVLRYSLEDYAKVNGTAGSIFGAFYYIIIASINLITTQLHSETSIKFSILFFSISLIAYKLFNIAQNIVKDNVSPYRAH